MPTIKLSLSYNQVLSLVKQMTLSEREKLISEISIIDTEIPIEIQKISLERLAKYKKNPELFLDWDKVSKTLISE